MYRAPKYGLKVEKLEMMMWFHLIQVEFNVRRGKVALLGCKCAGSRTQCFSQFQTLRPAERHLRYWMS